MRALPASLALLAVVSFSAACTSSKDSPARPESGDTPAGQTSPAAPDSSPTADVSDPTPSTTSPSAPSDRLLPTALVPGLNPAWRWQDGATGAAGSRPFGLCARADLASIGATDVVERTYFPPDDSDDNAAEQVAEFPDANTAARAWAVLKSWHDRCAGRRTANPGLTVGAIAPVPVTAGSARWYLLSWRPAGEETGRFETFGMVLDGTRVAVLRMDHSGQDHSYPAGRDPMVAMVRAASGRMG